MNFPPARIRYFSGLGICLASLAFAVLYLEGVVGLEPCPLCVLDRILFWILAGVFALAAFQNPPRHERIGYDIGIFVFAAAGIAVTARHIQLQSQPLQGLGDCGAGFWDIMEKAGLERAVSQALQGSSDCGTIQYEMFGFTLPQMTQAVFGVLLLIAVADFVQALRHRP